MRFPVLTLLIGALFLACSPAAPARSESPDEPLVAGSVTYDEDVSLPPDAAVDVWIVDVTPGVAPVGVVAETTIEAGNVRPPIPYKLRYAPSRVLADHDYAIKAVIRSKGQTLFEMPNDFLVLTKGRPDRVDVWVKKVGVAAAPPAASPAAKAPPAVLSLAGTLWRVEDLGGEAVPGETEATLDFADAGRIAGRAFCNRFSGKVEISGSSIRIGPLAATKMACAQPAMEREKRFLAALQKADRFVVDASTLFIFFEGSDSPLRLSRR